jgi:hypothetical protein
MVVIQKLPGSTLPKVESRPEFAQGTILKCIIVRVNRTGTTVAVLFFVNLCAAARRYDSFVGVLKSTQLQNYRARSYGGRSTGVFGTLTYPHIILQYSAYYGYIASHYGGPWCSPKFSWCDEKHLQVPEPPIYGEMVGLPVLCVFTMGQSPYKAAPIRFFKFVWGLPAGTKGPKN